jgi:hypothetical protein
VAREDLWVVEVAAIDYSFDIPIFANSLRPLGHIGLLRPIRAAVRSLVRYNPMMLGIENSPRNLSVLGAAQNSGRITNRDNHG